MRLTENHLDLYKTICERGIGRGCNDLNPNEVKMLTQVQWKEFSKNFHDWNGDPEIFEERGTGTVPNYVLTDFMVVDYIRHLLLDAYMVASQEIS